MSPEKAADPYAAAYFQRALERAKKLRQDPTLETIGEYEVVHSVEGSNTFVHIARAGDGDLVVLKGFKEGKPVVPLHAEILQGEALRLILHGYSASLPIEEIVQHVPGGSAAFLRLRYCQGGSLRDRIDAGDLPTAEAAFHGLAIAYALEKLHNNATVHGDVKPGNILFGHALEDGGTTFHWRTWLADLETAVAVGGPTSWRMTEAYAAPEQIAGALASPAMDIWAWAWTVHEALGASRPSPQDRWSWLHALISRARSTDPDSRPTAEEIVAVYGRNVAFEAPDGTRIGAQGEAAAVYPISSHLPGWLDRWPGNMNSVRMKLGWVAWLRECETLYDLHTEQALRRIDELSTRVLGDPADPGSVWQALRDQPRAATVLPPPEARVRLLTQSAADRIVTSDPGPYPMPGSAALQFVTQQARALVELLEATGEPALVDRLGAVAEAWDRIGCCAEQRHISILAQAWLSLDDPEHALPLLVGEDARFDLSQDSLLAALRLYLVITGRRFEAALTMISARVTLVHRVEELIRFTRWLDMAIRDLLEARAYTELDQLFAMIDRIEAEAIKRGERFGRTDTRDLYRLVAAGRTGTVHADEKWRKLRDFCEQSIGPTTSIHKLAYFAEAALQRSEDDLSRRLARSALGRKTLRMAVNHEERTAIEALALGRHPTDRSVTSRLNNRADLWTQEGKPDDPLLGLSLVTARRWAARTDGGRLSASAVELVERSVESLSARLDRGLNQNRRCLGCSKLLPLDKLSICGHCHRSLCVATCVTDPALVSAHECECGGDLTYQ